MKSDPLALVYVMSKDLELNSFFDCVTIKVFQLVKFYIVFGWVDFRGDGKYRRENLSFPLFGNERKMGGVEN